MYVREERCTRKKKGERVRVCMCVGVISEEERAKEGERGEDKKRGHGAHATIS